MDEDDDDLQSVIERALRRASLPASNEAQVGFELHPVDPPEPIPMPYDDGD